MAAAAKKVSYMERLQGRARDYSWGSPQVIPALFGYPPAHMPVAEVWLGAHPDDPARVGCGDRAPLFDPEQIYSGHTGNDGILAHAIALLPDSAANLDGMNESPTLEELIATDPAAALGEEVVDSLGDQLPYLLKIIAPTEPLSLQVHPSLEQAQAGFAAEEAAGIPRRAPNRNYRDANHKPELAYALTRFEALAGFRAPRRIATVLRGLDTPLTNAVREIVVREGVRAAFSFLLAADSRPDEQAVAEVVEACARRDPEESPSRRADAAVLSLAGYYPGDPGVVASLLMNPVTLHPGEALFIPDGTVHAYLSGVAIEIMAASDNVLRAGLTPKHLDVPELLRVVRADAAPPVRIAPERNNRTTSTFYAPVDDFELSVITLRDTSEWVKQPGLGPRTLVCLEGAAQAWANGEVLAMNAGQAIFIPASDGWLSLRGFGKLVMAGVP